MKKRALFFCWVFILINNFSVAQVEIYRPDKPDTATYIAPEDTITKAPVFGKDPDDFYRYLESKYNMQVYGKYLNYYPDNIRFSFYVERNGNISDFKILNASQMMVGGEIERIVLYMPQWEPGRQDGKKRRTLMIYDINIQMVNELPGVQVTKNGMQTEFSNRHKSLKWFLVGGSVLILLTLLITKS